MLAELTIGPLIVTWAAVDFSRLRRARSARTLEAAALFASLLVVCLVVFDLPQTNANVAPALFYAPLPFLLWAAMRLGPAGTASALALMTVATIWGAVHGLGPFAGGAPQDVAREMQLFLTAVAVPMLLLAMALEERGRAQRDATEQRKQLTHLSRVAMLGELSGGIAHELNQPLTAILSNAQAAQHFIANKSADPEVLVEILRDIITADQRAGEVIRRLRALFKRGETQFQPLDANELVQEVLGIMHGDLVLRAVEPVTQLAEALPAVQGDRVELQQVLLNLVMNACDAMAGDPRRSSPADPAHPDHRKGLGADHRHRLRAGVRRRAVREAVRAFLYHQAPGPGTGPLDLARHHPRPRRAALGQRRPRPGRKLPHRLARITAEGLSGPADEALSTLRTLMGPWSNGTLVQLPRAARPDPIRNIVSYIADRR